jgi:single-strand DNA-binding protein
VFQQCMIIGNLGKDPEMRYTPDGTPVTSFSVAVTRKWGGGEGGQGGEKTWWFKVTCWRKLAETTNQYLKKGKQVMVIGEIDASAFMGQDGQPRAGLELTAREVKFLGGARDDGGGSGAAASGGFGSGPSYAQEEEDIPF